MSGWQLTGVIGLLGALASIVLAGWLMLHFIQQHKQRMEKRLEALKKAGIQVVVRPHEDKRAKKDLFPPVRRDVLGIFLPGAD